MDAHPDQQRGFAVNENIQPHRPGALARAWAWLDAHLAGHNDLAALSAEDLRELAVDLAISEDDLRDLANTPNDDLGLLNAMLQARGFDPAELRDRYRALMRDVERLCTHCADKGRCQAELAAGTAAAHAHEFCPNAGTFDTLVKTSPGVPA